MGAASMILLVPMSNAVVLDWDGVIFCDDLYREDLFGMLAQYVPSSEVSELYEETKDSNGFNDIALATAVAQRAGVNPEGIINASNEILSRTASNYLFPDAIEFIHQAHEAGIPLHVLTAGSKRIQSHKISCSNLQQFFAGVTVVPAHSTEHAKQQALESMAKNYTATLFFDDRLSTIVHLHSLLGTENAVTPVYVNRIQTQVHDSHKQVEELSIQWVMSHFAYG